MSRIPAKVSGILLAIAALICIGCSSEKRMVQGSPEWLWQAAHESYTAGDLEKTEEHLEKIERQGNNPFVQRARAWRMVLDAGLATAHLELAQAYADGWTYTRGDKATFARSKSNHQKESKRHGLHLLQAHDAFVKDMPKDAVVLEFAFPKGSAAQVVELEKIYKGMAISDEERAAATEKTLNRGVVRSVSAVLTTADDSAGAQKLLQSGRAEAPPARFLVATAAALDKTSAVFDRRQLSEPDTQKAFRERAVDAAKRALELKPEASVETAAKKLQTDVEKALKAPPRRVASTAR